MKIYKICTSIILVFALVLSMSACGQKSQDISNLMTKFEQSCNKLDLNSMLDCINPKIAEGVKLATGIVGMFADKDTDEMLNGLAKLLLDEAPEDAKSFFSSIKITQDEVKVDENTATATATIKYTISGEEYVKKAIFEYVCADEKWYIANLDIE